MNIKELIAELQGYQENVSNAMIPIYETPEVCKKAAKALLAQQIVIEQMREALESFDGLLDYTGNAEKRRRTALALQPSLTALREHDAEVCQEFANFLGIEKREDVVKWIGAVRKGG